jgi:ADP-heptose:LPS heptosyltransferase
VGFSLPARWRSLNLTHGIPFDHTIHVSALFVEQLSPFEFDPAGDPDFPVLRSTAEERQSMRRKLSLGENGCTVVTINMNAGQTSLERRWPPERFTEVARKLAAGPGRVRFLFTGSAGERAYIDSALEAEPLLAACSTNCAGILSLGEFIAALEVSSVFLTNDSGPMHIAAAVGTPTVALFGPESPHFYGPLRNASIIYKQISCSPCLNVYTAKLHLCPFNARCMREITVEDVLASLRPILVSSARRQALLSPAVTA